MHKKKVIFILICSTLLLSLIFNYIQLQKTISNDRNIVYIDQDFSSGLLRISEDFRNISSDQHELLYTSALENATTAYTLAKYTSYSKETDLVLAYPAVMVTEFRNALHYNYSLQHQDKIADLLSSLSDEPTDQEKIDELLLLLKKD